MRSVWVIMFIFFALAMGTTPSSSTERIVVVGDLHADLESAKRILTMAEIISPATEQWSASNGTTLIQMGDLLDRGPDDGPILDFFIGLRAQAKEAGGRVINLFGNHELMNLAGQYYYVHEKSDEHFNGNHHSRRRAFSSIGKYGTFIRNEFKLCHVEFGTLFVHAGMPPSFAHEGCDALALQVQEALQTDNFNAHVLGPTGPIWTRKQIMDAEHGDCQAVQEALKLLGVERMVIGHTPQRSGRLGVYCNDSLIAVDVGISKWMYGGIAALEMSYEEPHSSAESAPSNQQVPRIVLKEIYPRSATVESSAKVPSQKSSPKSDLCHETTAPLSSAAISGASCGGETGSTNNDNPAKLSDSTGAPPHSSTTDNIVQAESGEQNDVDRSQPTNEPATIEDALKSDSNLLLEILESLNEAHERQEEL